MIRYLDVHQSPFLGPLRLAAYVLLLGCFLLGLSYSSTAHATFHSGQVGLSAKVSAQEDGNQVPFVDPIIYSDLTAEFDFTISTQGQKDILTLTVTNLTTGEELFDINEVFFNASSNVTDLTYEQANYSTGGPAITGDWAFEVDPNSTGGPTMADGFGIFDFAMIDGVGGGASDIGPNESVLFKFEIFGTGPYLPSDFLAPDLLSRPPANDKYSLSVIAAKFVQRRGSDGTQTQGQIDNDSAYGAMVPEPGSAMLLALGALSLLGYRGRSALL